MSDSPKAWLSDGMMNLLVDYYTEVPFRPYGSGATRENVLPVLRELDLGYICIYAKGHSGYTTWESSLKTRHVMLEQDMPRFFREVTRETGTKLVLYYSGLLDGIAGLRHPEWRMLHQDDSEQRYFDDFAFLTSYANCPHSGYFDEWVAVHLREMIEGYDPDGIWVDGDWPSSCYCARCQAVFREEMGYAEPWSDVQRRPEFAAEYTKFWNRVTARWRERFNRLVKSLKPDCAYSAGNISPRCEFLTPFDWRSGDFFSPGFFLLHDMARMMRWYDTLGVPYDAYVCDTSFTHVRKHVRSRTKTLDRMLQEAATVAANGGAVGYWTYPNGDGAFVPSRMEKAKRVRSFLREREDVFLHAQSAHWTALVVTDPATPTFGGANVEGAHKALAALHRSPELMDETGVSADMPHALVVVPEQAVMDEDTAKRLVAYAERGGRLLTSGATLNSSVLRAALGVTEVRAGAVQDGHVLLKTHDEPTGVDAPWDQVIGGEELYPLYLSWDQFNPEARHLPNNWPMHGEIDEAHPEPAGFPAAITRRVGQGSIAHICTAIFDRYKTLGDPQMLRWLREIVDALDPQPYFRTDAPTWVDVSLRRKNGMLLIHFVNQNPGRDVARLGTDDTWVDEIPVVGPYRCDIRLPKSPEAVTLEPGGEPTDWHYADEVLTVVLPKLWIHACVKIK
ncbi:MAG: Alpha-L-fucosidase [bacterium ADurb.Bin429]|nr:MAG: Alpha-L-fucosidase [bacterium ADurb.Bin429]